MMFTLFLDRDICSYLCMFLQPSSNRLSSLGLRRRPFICYNLCKLIMKSVILFLLILFSYSLEQLNLVHCFMVGILMKWRFRYHFLSLLSLLIHHFSLLLVLLQISSLFWSFILLCNWRTKEEDCQEIKKEKEKRRGGREGTWKALHAEVHGASLSLGFNLCSSCFALSLWPLWSINKKGEGSNKGSEIIVYVFERERAFIRSKWDIYIYNREREKEIKKERKREIFIYIEERVEFKKL